MFGVLGVRVKDSASVAIGPVGKPVESVGIQTWIDEYDAVFQDGLDLFAQAGGKVVSNDGRRI